MDSISLSTIDTRVQEAMGDSLEFTVTTAIAASAVIISTTLRVFDFGSDDYFNGWWVYIKDYANAAVERRVSDYVTASGTLTVYGANLATDTANLATCQLSRFRRTDRVLSINDTLRELFPNSLHKRIDNQILITNNFLPNGHFEDQATGGTPDKWALTNVTGAAETTTIRGGAKAVKLTATAINGYIKLTVANYPRLLDLSGAQVTVKVWAYAQVADDADITIYTADKAGTTQTLTSTTTCLASTWTLLTLKDQVLNDDLVDIEIRFRVNTDTKWVIYDDARLIAVRVKEYLMPTTLDDGKIEQVFIQSSGFYESSDSNIQMCDSLAPQSWEEIIDSNIIIDGTNKWLRINEGLISEKRIRLFGTAPFTALSASTDAIVIDQDKIPMIVAYIKFLVYKRLSDTPSSDDQARYERASSKAYGDYVRLSHKRTAVPARTMKLPEI